MNRLMYRVTNYSSAKISNIRLKVRLESYESISEKFSLDGGATLNIPVTVGGYDDLPDFSSLDLTIEIKPNPDETIEIIKTGEIDVSDGMLVTTILNEEFALGGTGVLRFTIENTGGDEIEILSSLNSGRKASDEVIFYLLDFDGNVLSSEPYKQNLGDGIFNLLNGKSVARIPSGSVFTSGPVSINIPSNAPEFLTVRMEISNIYHDFGKTEQVTMKGLETTHDITMTDTPYTGIVTEILPQTSNGDEDITIKGKAIKRDTGDPKGNVYLKLVLSVGGFERSFSVYTEDDGSFTYTFQPYNGESGVYNVYAIHPELYDKPVQNGFVIKKISVDYEEFNVSLPKNYKQPFKINVTAGEGTEVNNLYIEYNAEDQKDGDFSEGVNIETG